MVNAERVHRSNQYSAILLAHLREQAGHAPRPFRGLPIIPRQLEVHLANPGSKLCNLSCDHCEGKELPEVRGQSHERIIELVENLEGAIPQVILSGANSEPTINPGLLDLIKVIRRSGANFGLHTNGTLLAGLERKSGFLTQLTRISTPNDYITISIDSGNADSFVAQKGARKSFFHAIAEAFIMLRNLREHSRAKCLKVRMTYLLNKSNSSADELREAADLAKTVQVDSLRFSVPYAPYGSTTAETLNFQARNEDPLFDKVRRRLAPILSKSIEDMPYIYALTPASQDVAKMDFSHCFFGHFALALGIDGSFYRCTSTASPHFVHHKIGSMTTTERDLYKILAANQDRRFNPLRECVPMGARCSRAALEINRSFERRFFGDG